MQPGLFQASIEDRGLVLDPRTKLFAVVTIFGFVIGGMGQALPLWLTLALSAVPAVLLACTRQWGKAVGFAAVLAVAWLLVRFVAPLVTGPAHVLLVMACLLVTLLGPGLAMGAYLLATTTVSEFMAAMHRMHVPDTIVIPLSVMFRFFPTVIEEMDSINTAMKMRDVSFGGRNAARLVEYRLVPLLACSARVGDELAAAALARGLEAGARRTNVCQVGFGLADAVVWLAMLVPYAITVATWAGVAL